MDHIEFENTMIECVNRNSKNADKARKEAYLAAKERAKRYKESDAAVRIGAWIITYLALVLFVVLLSRLELVPGEVPVIASAVIGLVVGIKLNALWRVFRKKKGAKK